MPAPSGERGFKFSEASALLGRPALFLLSLLLFLYVSCEVGVWNWLTSHLIAQGVPEPRALKILSLGFALGLLVGRVVVSRSLDIGETWSQPVPVSDDPSPADQSTPGIAVSQNGIVGVNWYDRRNDPSNTRIETFQSISKDGIQWPNQDISTTSWDPNLGFFKSGSFIGDYIGVNASTTHIYPTWADGRTTQIAVTGIGNTDIFTNVEVVKK